MTVVGGELSTPLPETPTNVRSERLTKTTVAIAWDPVTDLYISHYAIYRCATLSGTYVWVKNTGKLHYVDKYLDGETHYYYVIAVDKFDIASEESDIVNNITGTPDTLSGLVVDRTSGREITITWNESTNQYKKEYYVYRSTDDVTYDVVSIVSSPTFTDINLAPGAWYYKTSVIDKFRAESALTSAVSHTIMDLLPYKDTLNIPTAGTPVIVDVSTTLGRKASEGSLICLGPGKVQIEFSYDGTTYDQAMWLRQEDYYEISSSKDFMEVAKIRLDTDINNTQVTLSVI